MFCHVGCEGINLDTRTKREKEVLRFDDLTLIQRFGIING